MPMPRMPARAFQIQGLGIAVLNRRSNAAWRSYFQIRYSLKKLDRKNLGFEGPAQDWWLFAPFYHNSRCAGSGSGSTLFADEDLQREPGISGRTTENSSSSLKPALKKRNSLKIITKLNPDRPDRVFRRVQSDISLTESANITHNFNSSLFCESPTPIDAILQLFGNQPPLKKKRSIRFSTHSPTYTIRNEPVTTPTQFRHATYYDLENEDRFNGNWDYPLLSYPPEITRSTSSDTMNHSEQAQQPSKPESVTTVPTPSVDGANQPHVNTFSEILRRRSHVAAELAALEANGIFVDDDDQSSGASASTAVSPNRSPNTSADKETIKTTSDTGKPKIRIGSEIFFQVSQKYPSERHKPSIVGSIVAVGYAAFDLTSLLVKGNNKSWW